VGVEGGRRRSQRFVVGRHNRQILEASSAGGLR
jgi:hypothetical protein